MTDIDEEEVDCEEFPDHEDCKCMYDDGDALYDAWADDRVSDFFTALEEREKLYKKLLLCDHNGKSDERDELEKELVYNLTGKRGLWLNMNDLHEWKQE
jgi:hypothetical protein|tara:strand:- start:12279 stop:12575 length:297 start_codon:yes stop_codon:yes gene_type:complete